MRGNYIYNSKKTFNELQKYLKEYTSIKIKKRFEDCSNYLDDLELLFPNHPAIRFDRALLLLNVDNKNNDIDKGFEMLLELAEGKYENSNAAKYEIIKKGIYFKRKDLVEKYIFDKSLLKRKEALMENELGHYYLSLEKNYDEAKKHFEKAYNLGLKQAMRYINVINILLNNKSYNELYEDINEIDNLLHTKKLEVLHYIIKRDFESASKSLDAYTDISEKNINLVKLKFILTNNITLNRCDEIKRLINKYKDLLTDSVYLYYDARVDLLEGNIDSAEDKLITISKDNNNPTRDYALLNLCDIYNHKNENDKSLNILKELVKKDDTPVINEAKLSLVFIYLRLNKIDIAHDIFLSIDKSYKDTISTTCEQIKAIFNLYNYNFEILGKSKYSIGLINDYKKDEVINHIKKHDYNEKSKTFMTFKENIDYDLLYDKIIKIIDNIKPTISNNLFDKYIIKYDGIGYHHKTNKELDYLEVVCLYNSKKIITMYPTFDNNPFNKYNVSDEEKEDNVLKKEIKRESQIDKFKRKYGM